MLNNAGESASSGPDISEKVEEGGAGAHIGRSSRDGDRRGKKGEGERAHQTRNLFAATFDSEKRESLRSTPETSGEKEEKEKKEAKESAHTANKGEKKKLTDGADSNAHGDRQGKEKWGGKAANYTGRVQEDVEKTRSAYVVAHGEPIEHMFRMTGGAAALEAKKEKKVGRISAPGALRRGRKEKEEWRGISFTLIREKAERKRGRKAQRRRAVSSFCSPSGRKREKGCRSHRVNKRGGEGKPYQLERELDRPFTLAIRGKRKGYLELYFPGERGDRNLCKEGD